MSWHVVECSIQIVTTLRENRLLQIELVRSAQHTMMRISAEYRQCKLKIERGVIYSKFVYGSNIRRFLRVQYVQIIDISSQCGCRREIRSKLT